MSLRACSENASAPPASSGKPSRSFLSVASGILMFAISPVGFILNENSAPDRAFNCRTSPSNGSGTAVAGEFESYSNGMNGVPRPSWSIARSAG